MMRLFSISPGTTAGPVFPPLSMPSRESTSSPPLIFSAPWLWHLKQLSARRGRILPSKNCSSSGESFWSAAKSGAPKRRHKTTENGFRKDRSIFEFLPKRFSKRESVSPHCRKRLSDGSRGHCSDTSASHGQNPASAKRWHGGHGCGPC